MSHIIKLRVQVKQPALLAEVARARGLRVEEDTTVNFYSGTRSGLAVHLPGWKYPVVVDGEGNLFYDNYGGVWGDIAHLNGLVQDYVAAVVEAEARSAGQYAWREERADGTLVIRVGGGW